MSKISQEFYCSECKGYFLVRLNTGLNHEVEIVCPNCGHEHRRCVVEGQIFESGRYKTDSKEKVRPTKASYSTEPLTVKMKQTNYARDGAILTEQMRERWLEKAADDVGGKREHSH